MSADAANRIAVLATWQCRPEETASVIELVSELRRHSLRENGCLGYEVYRHHDDPCRFVLMECYRDAAALEAHRQSEHFSDLVLERIVPKLTARSVELLLPTTKS